MPTPDPEPAAPGPPRLPWTVRHRGRSLLLLFLGVVVIGGIAAVTAYTLFVGKLKDSEPYRLAVRQVADDPAVRAALGHPIEATYWAQGKIDEAKQYGEFTFRVRGPGGDGTARAISRRDGPADDWRLVFLDVATFADRQVQVVTLIGDEPPTGNLPQPTEEAKQRYGVE